MSPGPKTGDEEFGRFERFLEEWSRRDFLRRMGGAAAMAAFTAGGIGLLEACASGGSSPGVAPVRGGHLVEGWPTDIKHFLSVLTSDANSQLVQNLCFEPLLHYDSQTGDVLPALARAQPRRSADDLTHTFELRQDVRWSDGQPLTADDVVFTYSLMFDPAYADVSSPVRGSLSATLASVTAPDKYTVVMTTRKPDSRFLAQFGNYGILPKHVLGSLSGKEINTAPFDKAPTVTSGPFKFVRWDSGQQVVLARNDGYHLGASYLDQYVYKVVPDTIAVGNQLKTGEIDTGVFDVSMVDNLKAEAGVRSVVFDGPNIDFYGYQVDPAKPASQFFGDKNVRQALAHGLDRQGMVSAAYAGQARVATGFEPFTSWAYDPDVKPAQSYDKARAQAMLDAAGWKLNTATGIRERNGVPFKFEMLTSKGNKPRESMLSIMQQQWKEIGIDATPNPIPLPQLGGLVTGARTFDLFLLGLVFPTSDGDQTTWRSTSAAPGGLNGMPYKNPQVDDLLDQATQTFDRVKRKQLYARVQDIFNEDSVAVILTYPKRLWGIGKRVHGFQIGPYGQYGSRSWMKDVFVTDGK